MASNVRDINRNVIPLWRTYDQTFSSGELASTSTRISPVRFDRFEDFVAAWQAKKNILTAADMLNAAIVSDNTKMTEALQAAEYIVLHEAACSPLTLDVAKGLLVSPVEDQHGDTFSIVAPNAKPKFEDSATSLIDELTDQDKKTKARIGLLRKQLRDFNYNPITYCELSRCYSEIGLNDKARFYMLCAVQLAPHNRYVSRCAARFFIHDGDPARARKILVSNGWMKSDPWLLASEIAVTSVMDRSSRYIKEGRQLILSGDMSPFSCSELCFAICKEDHKADKRKDWQKMFAMGLRNPNENSLAQAEFFVKEEQRMRFDYEQFGAMSRKSEADTRNNYSLKRFEDAFLSSMNWMREYRFSHEPVAFAFDISCTFLKKYDYAVRVLKHWLSQHPEDYATQNNLIYALGLSDQIDYAEKEMAKTNIRQQLKDENKTDNGICLLATQGLLEYRKGHIEEGRQWYQLSIDAAKRLRDNGLAGKARLNMIREEVRCGTGNNEALLKEIDTLETGNNAETEQLRADIRAEVAKKK